MASVEEVDGLVEPEKKKKKVEKTKKVKFDDVSYAAMHTQWAKLMNRISRSSMTR